MSVRIHPFVAITLTFSLGFWMSASAYGAVDDTRSQTDGKPVVEIGSRLELFVDDFLVDALSGDASRRMHRPTPREIVHTLDKPWEGSTSAYLAVVQDGGRIRIYYNASPRFRPQSPAFIESHDGIHFNRPNLGIVDFEGSTDNNLLPQFGTAGHHFTPFIDTNPEAAPDARYKAFARGPGGMRFYASPDGVDWRMMEHNPNLTPGPSDTQNLAFWDPVREQYVAYLRAFRVGSGPRPPGIDFSGRDADGQPFGSTHRCIRRAVSTNLVDWAETELIEYDDDRIEQLYTNGIRPYFRAPHIFIGLPNRFVTGRKKVAAHPNNGINDVVLMSSRDGIRFQRWVEAFIRPGPDPEAWTDRNNYPAWGMARTSPTELSLYWTEHYRYAGMRFRRGTIRVDGFASVHAGGAGGELLTRPLIFKGDRLVVNYQTSAAGVMRFELADEAGEPIPGFTLGDSEELFGNAIEHLVTWRGGADLATLAARPVRLRVHLRDADLFAIRFESAGAIRARLAATADEARAVLADPLPDFARRCREAVTDALDEYTARLARDRQLTGQATLESDFLIRRALHRHQACARLAAEAQEALDAADALPPPEDGFGGYYHTMLNALCDHLRATLADPAADPDGLQSVLTRVHGALADLDVVAERRAGAETQLMDAETAIDIATKGFGVLFQTHIAARRDVLAYRLADFGAGTETLVRATDALAEAVSAFRAVDAFPEVVPAEFTGTPPAYAERVAADWTRGMRVNLAVEDDDLTLVSEPTLCFDTGTARVHCPVGDALKPSAFTVEAWVKLQDPHRRWTPVVRIGRAPEGPPPRGGWTDIAWTLWLNGLRPQAAVRVGDDETLVRTRLGPSLDLDRWHHLAASFDGATVKLFVDGELATQVEQTGAIDYAWSEALVIGGCPHQEGSSYNSFRGRIRDVRIWDHARDETDIRNDRRRQMTGVAPGLVGHWIADAKAGEGETVFDLTGGGHDGRRIDARWLAASGYRIMGPIRFLDADQAVGGLRVAWQATVEGEASLDIFTGISDSPRILPEVWRAVVNGEAVPGVDAGVALADRYLWIKQTMTRVDPGDRIRLHALTLTLE